MSPPDLAEKKVGKYWLMTFVNFNSLVFKMTKIDTGHQKTGKFLKKNLFKRYTYRMWNYCPLKPIFLHTCLSNSSIDWTRSLYYFAYWIPHTQALPRFQRTLLSRQKYPQYISHYTDDDYQMIINDIFLHQCICSYTPSLYRLIHTE